MIHFKSTVDFRILQPQTVLAIMVADQQLPSPALSTFITSICDDAPGRLPTSLHKTGFAIDIRLLATDSLNQAWVANIKRILDHDYDVILEKDHIHIEFQPKNKTWSTNWGIQVPKI